MNENTRPSHTSSYTDPRTRYQVTLKHFDDLSFDVVVGKASNVEAAHQTQASPAPEGGESPGARKPSARVLVADDTPSVRESLAKLLRSEGYEVEVAANGRETLEIFDSELIDLVLLDLQMPVIHGWDALGQILARKPQQAVIVITGQPEPCGWAGVTRPGILIEKPINVPLLLEAVREALAESKVSRGERITVQRMLTRHTRPLPEHVWRPCYQRGGLNE